MCVGSCQPNEQSRGGVEEGGREGRREERKDRGREGGREGGRTYQALDQMPLGFRLEARHVKRAEPGVCVPVALSDGVEEGLGEGEDLREGGREGGREGWVE
jgi:hypothetical protein